MRLDAGKEQAAIERRARDDAAARHHRGHGLPTAALLVVDELGGGRQLGIGPDRPFGVPEVQLGGEIRQVDIGLPEGVDGAHILPVGRRARRAQSAWRVRHDRPAWHICAARPYQGARAIVSAPFSTGFREILECCR